MNVDGASNSKRAGIKIILTTPEGSIIEQSLTLGFPASNNETEYEVVIVRLQTAITLGVTGLEVRCDSSLVVNQVSGEYITRDSWMAEYLRFIFKLKSKIFRCDFKWIPTPVNNHVDSLANLGQPQSFSSDRKSPSSTSLTRASDNQLERSYASTPHQDGGVPSLLT